MAVFKKDSTALITGGASGIGLALAKHCLAQGMRVLVADISTPAIPTDPNLFAFQIDVSKPEEWAELKGFVDEKFRGTLNLLALNAGTGLLSSWTDTASFIKTLDTNLFGVIHGISTFLDTVKASATEEHPGAVVVTGSKQGITNPPGNAAYNTSKAAVKTLTEHLSYDLRSTPNISVHLLVPGWTYTKLTGASPTKEKPAGAWGPEQVVDYLVQKMNEGKFYVICPDNDVTEEMDRKRMLWSVGDIVEGRQPLSRWREEYKEEVDAWMKQ
ncbi:hypothetical protein OQA88_12406 [Cercophora sp. LCS_1]